MTYLIHKISMKAISIKGLMNAKLKDTPFCHSIRLAYIPVSKIMAVLVQKLSL